MASRSLSDLAQPVAEAAGRMLALCEQRGLDVLVYCTLRSTDEQAALWAQGRSAPGRIVTQCRPGMSLHNPDAQGKAWAFDALPLVNGKAAWADAGALQAMGECGEAVGLQWAGRWVGALRERVHFQMKPMEGAYA